MDTNNAKSKRKHVLHSLRFKIIILILLLGIIPFSVFVPLSMHIFQDVSLRTESQNIITQAFLYNNEIVTSGYYTGTEVDRLDDSLKALASDYHGRILVIDSALKIQQDSYNADIGKTVVWGNVVRTVKGETLYYYDKNTDYLIVTVPLTNLDNESVGAIVINKSMDYVDQEMSIFWSYCLIGGVIVISISIFLAAFLGIRFTKPMKNTEKALDDIIIEYNNLLPEISSYSEIEEISTKFNEILQKLHEIDSSRQEFVSNVSHELKTPLTSMKVLADSLNGSADVPIDMYKEFMADIGDEIDRETKIINDLLSLVRMDKSGASLNISAVNMNELIEHVLKRLMPIANKASVEVVFESFRPVVAEIDEVKFTLVVTNLVENAIKYNNEGGWVHITLNSDHQFCYIKVSDNGLGIPEDSVEHIFDRFYRADKSHSREIGGTGLGLAITKSAIAMHRGDIKVQSVLNEGTTFDVRIPLNHIEETEV